MRPPELLADYAGALPEIVIPWQPSLPDPRAGNSPRMLAVNADLARELGLDPQWLSSPQALAVLGARAVLPGSTPVAQAYAGHQFGGFSPLLGDGRAVLLGEVRDDHGRLRDLALKGSGRTPFSRGGDGRAALGPVLREYLFGEAMHALGIPTTRALAVVATGDRVFRDGGMPPGAVLTRVANSHLRVGTFEVVARSLAPELREPVLRRLVAYAVRRHLPELAPAPHTTAGPGPGPGPETVAAEALALLDAVVGAQADLVARWVAVGFVHGVVNTDNTTISGETIDYGPCAWLETYDPDAVFSSIDTGGRYRFGNQAPIMLWNLGRFAETLLPLIAPDPNDAVAQASKVLETFPERHRAHLADQFARKLALTGSRPEDAALVSDLLEALNAGGADYTATWRLLAAHLRSDRTEVPGVPPGWLNRWVERLDGDRTAAATAMDAVNPAYVPRNHLVEEALAAAVAGDLAPFERLLGAVREPYVERSQWRDLAASAPAGFTERHVTYCGT